LHKIPGTAKPLNFPDAAETGRRLRLKGKIPAGRMYLYYEVEKTSAQPIIGSALQSDYEVKWAGA